MKKLATLLIVAICFIGCNSTPQKKAEKAVSKSLIIKTKEHTDYQPISFGKLDTIQLKKVSAYQMATDSFQYYKNLLNVTDKQENISIVQQKTKAFKQEIKHLENYYQNKKFSIQHQYKVNIKGTPYDKDEVFYLNSKYEVVD